MKLLILGGTIFLGRHIVENALERGHTVTLFNRCQHNPTLFPEAERICGDRDGGLDVLDGQRWDAVIDTCGYVPRIVQASAQKLAKVTDHYTFVSSISVYASFREIGIDESAPVAVLQDETTETVTGETYGALKALCEQAAEQALPRRTLNIRPGLIVGPHDPTDRFTYWPHRVTQGGDVLAPGRPDHRIQIIDVRDLAEWILRMVEHGKTGVYNATGPEQALTMEGLLTESKRVSNSDAEIIWADEHFLLEAGVAPWTDMPLWIPDGDGEDAGADAVNCRKAVAEGLVFRRIEDTIAATLAWAFTRPDDYKMRAGINREREQDLLAQWRRKN